MGFFANMKKDIIAMFDSSKLNSRDSEMILMDLETEFMTFVSIEDVIESLQANVYKGKKAMILKAIYDELSEGKSVEDLFLKYGLIDHDEYMIFSKANSMKDAVRATMQYRNNGNVFPKIISMNFGPIIFFTTLSLVTLRFLGEAMVKYFNEELKPVFALKSGFQPVIKFPSIIENTTLSTSILVGWIAFVLLLFFLYSYIYKTSPENTYKISEIKFYDDFIKYFTIADKMHKVGASSDEIFEYLKEHAQPIGLRNMYKEIFEAGSDMYMVLEKYNCPPRLSSMVRRKENSSTFWNDLEVEVLGYVSNAREKRFEFYKKYVSKMVYYVGFLSLIGSLIGLMGTFGMTVWMLM
jgi:type II secretory pathway component PulF